MVFRQADRCGDVDKPLVLEKDRKEGRQRRNRKSADNYLALPFLGAAWLEMDTESFHHALDLGDGMADRFFGAIQV
jgi:hypothetical protein